MRVKVGEKSLEIVGERGRVAMRVLMFGMAVAQEEMTAEQARQVAAMLLAAAGAAEGRP